MAINGKPLYVITEDQASLHLSKGNAKIGKGIWSFSTLPGNAEHLLRTATPGLLTDVPGTCGRLCGCCFSDCYARKSALLHHNACVPAWAENTVLLRSGRLWEQLAIFINLKNGKAEKYLDEAHKQGIDPGYAIARAAELATIKVFRINVSGEVENAEQFRRWALLAQAHGYIRFALYTKNFEALGEYLDWLEENRMELPANFAIQISQWHHCADAFIAKYAERWSLGIFEYDDSFVKGCEMSDEDKARLAKIPHCPGIDKKGRHRKTADGSDFTCDRCQGRMSCYNKNYRHIAIYAH